MLVKRWQGTNPRMSGYHTLADLLVLFLTFWLMKGPGGVYSATSIAVLLVGLATFFTIRRENFQVRHLDRMVRTTLFGAGVAFLLVGLLEFSPLASVSSLFGRDETLTGRSDLIWDVLIPIAWKNIVFGVGYGGFWVERPDGFDFKGHINQAHNGYLDVILELGVVGLVLLLVLIVSFFMKARREFEHNHDWASFRIAFLPVLLLHNVTETDFLRSTLPLWNLFVFLMVVYPITVYHKQDARELPAEG